MANKVISDDCIKNLNNLLTLAPNTLITPNVLLSLPKLKFLYFYKQPYDTHVLSQTSLQQISAKGIAIYLDDKPLLFK